VLFFFYRYGARRYLHSFPTRRSSDLLGPRKAKSPAGFRGGAFCKNRLWMTLGMPSWKPAASKDERRIELPPMEWNGRDLPFPGRSEEHTSELQSQSNLVCRLLLEKKK